MVRKKYQCMYEPTAVELRAFKKDPKLPNKLLVVVEALCAEA